MSLDPPMRDGGPMAHPIDPYRRPLLAAPGRRARRELRIRALHELAERRRSLAATMATARTWPEDADVIDVADRAMAVHAAEAVVRALGDAPGGR
jgi:hypothetical protein